jgi:hypothetical protein
MDPFQCSWESVQDMKQTPRVWYNFYGSSMIETTLPPKQIQTKSVVYPLTTPTAVQLNSIQTNKAK